MEAKEIAFLIILDPKEPSNVISLVASHHFKPVIVTFIE